MYQLTYERPDTEPSFDITDFLNYYGAPLLLDCPKRVLIEALDDSYATIAACDALADHLAQRDICVIAPMVSSQTPAVVITACCRHAGACVIFASKDAVHVPAMVTYELNGEQRTVPGVGRRQPVMSARVWDELLDPVRHLYIWGAGLLRPARKVATHIVTVGPPFDAWAYPSAWIEGHIR